MGAVVRKTQCKICEQEKAILQYCECVENFSFNDLTEYCQELDPAENDRKL